MQPRREALRDRLQEERRAGDLGRGNGFSVSKSACSRGRRSGAGRSGEAAAERAGSGGRAKLEGLARSRAGAVEGERWSAARATRRSRSFCPARLPRRRRRRPAVVGCVRGSGRCGRPGEGPGAGSRRTGARGGWAAGARGHGANCETGWCCRCCGSASVRGSACRLTRPRLAGQKHGPPRALFRGRRRPPSSHHQRTRARFPARRQRDDPTRFVSTYGTLIFEAFTGLTHLRPAAAQVHTACLLPAACVWRPNPATETGFDIEKMH